MLLEGCKVCVCGGEGGEGEVVDHLSQKILNKNLSQFTESEIGASRNKGDIFHTKLQKLMKF